MILNSNQKLRLQVNHTFEVEASSEIDKESLNESFKISSRARLLSQVFGVDVLKCDCGSELKPVSAILKGDEIKRYLRHLGLDADPPEPKEMETEEKSTFSRLGHLIAGG